MNDPDELRLEGVHGTLVINKAAHGVVRVVLSGRDVGEFQDVPFRAVQDRLAEGPAWLFIDARDAASASVEVSASWAAFLVQNRSRLERVTMLTATRFLGVTAGVVHRFSELGEAMQVTSDPAEFDVMLRAAVRRASEARAEGARV